MQATRTEVCVVGGGPAGSTVALRLAQLGHQVCLLERAPFPRPHVGESLPPTILPLLEVLGVRRRIEGAGFLRPGGATVRWAGARKPEQDAAGEGGFQVDRGRFDALLLAAAAAAGARVQQPARARASRRRGSGWQLEVRTGEGSRRLESRFLVDACGRTGAFHRGRRRRLGAPTLALFGYWRGVDPASAATRIEASEAEWFWGAPLPDGSFNATVFVDPKRAPAEGLSPQALYLRLLARSDLLRTCLAGELIGPVRGCDATSHAADDPIFADGLRVGESCFAIDPLSSQGVQTAIRSALQAAVVAHTLLRFPGDSEAAAEFYRQRVAESVHRHAEMAGRFYAAEARSRDRPSPFWQARQGSGSRAGVGPGPLPPPPEETRVGLHPEARLQPSPVLTNDRIQESLALTHPALDRPIAFVGGQRIASLLNDLAAGPSAREVVRRWTATLGAGGARELFRQLWDAGVLHRHGGLRQPLT